VWPPAGQLYQTNRFDNFSAATFRTRYITFYRVTVVRGTADMDVGTPVKINTKAKLFPCFDSSLLKTAKKTDPTPKRCYQTYHPAPQLLPPPPPPHNLPAFFRAAN
jgi:hypothetical protein